MNYTLELPAEQVNVIVSALMELPIKTGLFVLQNIEKQIIEQNENQKQHPLEKVDE